MRRISELGIMLAGTDLGALLLVDSGREVPPQLPEPGIRRFLKLSTKTGCQGCACGCGSPVAANKLYKRGHGENA